MVVVGLLFLLNVLGKGNGMSMLGPKPDKLVYSEFMTELESGNIKTANWQGAVISGEFQNNSKYTVRAFLPDSDSGKELSTLLRSKNVKVEFSGPSAGQAIMPVLGFLIIPLVFLAVIYFVLIKPAQQGGNQAMSFGRSKARRVGEQHPKITFADVAGVDEATEELAEIVDYLQNTKKYVALGAKIPKGILLTGPPGVGKTHLARAIAGEAGVPFFHISGSDFVEMFVGVGAARVRDLFETAKAHRPCLIFVDEIDAVGRQRGAGLGGGHDEREQTLNQLLVEMDGFEANTGVIMIAATNRPDVLDPALLRPGRFDRTIVVDIPDVIGRAEILEIHAKGKPFTDDVDLKTVAKRTPGFTGADLANCLNEAALLAARREHTAIQMSDIEEALDRVMAGPERKNRVMDKEERRVIAYHEAGHAVVGELLEHSDPVHKVTILPRGMSLGATWQLPEKDTFLIARSKLLDDVTSLLGGRVAEEIEFNEVTTGAANDLQRVTAITRAMVTEYGMSENLGALAIGRKSSNPFLGRDYVEDRNYSEDIARLVDEEVRHLVDTCHRRAEELLLENRGRLDNVVEALIKHETLDREEFLAAMEGLEIPEKAKIVEPAAASTVEPDELPEPESTVETGKLEPGTASGQA
ncbi:MAG: ATP-dependent zinc metalloprotease FtsH [Armatimonadetes bacterium]|nr:ATP-dependent zinc metalloprotease FtsH [Armatimonadota bacterium]